MNAALLALATAGPLGLLPAAAAQGEGGAGPGWIADLKVAFGRSETGMHLARVEVQLRPAASGAGVPPRVEVGMAKDGWFPEGYGSHVWGFTAEPEPEPVSMADGRYRLRPRADGTLAYRYGVALDHDATRSGPGPDEAPYAFGTGAFWTGRALFILPAGTKGRVTFQTDPGERLSTSLDPVPDQKGVFSFPGEERLQETFLVAGTQAEAEFTVGKTTIVLAMGEALRGWLPTVKDSITRFMATAGGIFGTSPARRVLVVLNHLPGFPGTNGGVFGRDVTLLVADPSRMSEPGTWEGFVGHELFHLWNGPAMAFEDQQAWFTEGFTDYYSRLLLLRMGATPWKSFIEDLEGATTRYLEEAGSMGLLAAGNAEFQHQALVYDGGSLAALCLDVTVRKSSGGRSTLDDVMRALHAGASQGKPDPRGVRPIQDALEAAAGTPQVEFFIRHIGAGQPLPLAQAFAELGLVLDVQSETLPTTDWCVFSGLRSPSVTSEADGLHILRTDHPALRVGDVVKAVGSMDVRDFGDLRAALKRKGPRDVVQVRLSRSGTASTIDMVLGGEKGIPAPTTRVVRTTIREAEDAGEGQKALRKALFGR